MNKNIGYIIIIIILYIIIIIHWSGISHILAMWAVQLFPESKNVNAKIEFPHTVSIYFI